MAVSQPQAGGYSDEAAEARNPALHNSAHYYQGTVQQAIADSRTTNSFLVIFLKGGDHESYIADETLHVSLGFQPLNCIALRLHDELSDMDPGAFSRAKAFREIFPNIRQLPFMMVLSPEGRPIASLQSTDVAKLAPYVLQKTATEYPYRESSNGSGQLDASGELQQQAYSVEQPQVPNSPVVSEASSATAHINSSLSAATGMPSQFPHSNVQALGHALLVVGQQAAQSAAVSATPSARFNATAGATANPPSFSTTTFSGSLRLPGTGAPSHSGPSNNLAISQQGLAASPSMLSSAQSEQSALELPEPSMIRPAASFGQGEAQYNTAEPEFSAASNYQPRDPDVGGEPQADSRAPMQLSEGSGNLAAERTLSRDAWPSEAAHETMQPERFASAEEIEAPEDGAASFVNEMPQASSAEVQPRAADFGFGAGMPEDPDRLSSEDVGPREEEEFMEAKPAAGSLENMEYQPLHEEAYEAPRGEASMEVEPAAASMENVEYQPLHEEAYEAPIAADSSCNQQYLSQPDLSEEAATSRTINPLDNGSAPQEHTQVLEEAYGQQESSMPYQAFESKGGASMALGGTAMAAHSKQPESSTQEASGDSHALTPEQSMISEERMPLLHPTSMEPPVAVSNGLSAPHQTYDEPLENAMCPLASSEIQTQPMAIEETPSEELLGVPNSKGENAEPLQISSDNGKFEASHDFPSMTHPQSESADSFEAPAENSADQPISQIEVEEPGEEGLGQNEALSHMPDQEPSAAIQGQRQDSALTTSPQKAYLAIRLTDGSFLRTDFPAESLLSDVLDYIDRQRSDGHAPYILRTPYPHRYLDTGNGSQTLAELDLCPRSMLALQPTKAAVAYPSTHQITGLGQRLAATITTYITAIVALLAGFFFGMLQGSPARSERHAAHSGPQISSRQHSALADESDSDASATPFRGGTVFAGAHEGNLHLRQREAGVGNDEGNVYYNGNSTEFKGNDDY